MTKGKEKRCIKFTGYIYLPKEEELENMTKKYNLLDKIKFISAWFRTPRMGRLILFDEFNNKKEGKALAFRNTGEMVHKLEEEIRNRMNKTFRNFRKGCCEDDKK
jgi:hypothetical protein